MGQVHLAGRQQGFQCIECLVPQRLEWHCNHCAGEQVLHLLCSSCPFLQALRSSNNTHPQVCSVCAWILWVQMSAPGRCRFRSPSDGSHATTIIRLAGWQAIPAAIELQRRHNCRQPKICSPTQSDCSALSFKLTRHQSNRLTAASIHSSEPQLSWRNGAKLVVQQA